MSGRCQSFTHLPWGAGEGTCGTTCTMKAAYAKNPSCCSEQDPGKDFTLYTSVWGKCVCVRKRDYVVCVMGSVKKKNSNHCPLLCRLLQRERGRGAWTANLTCVKDFFFYKLICTKHTVMTCSSCAVLVHFHLLIYVYFWFYTLHSIN